MGGIRIWFEANNLTGRIECKRTFAQIKDFENVVFLKKQVKGLAGQMPTTGE